eukprot:GFUD01039474.1.p1 GENE.GFUD01039474.1~~GFUD01039474.1.p1  ORF type:complete len:431 (+),score=81.96 GFUD01039474.1:234-1526(+)
MRNLFTFLQDPSLVCQFQAYFGVEKIAEVEHVKSGSWIATELGEDCLDMSKKIDKSKDVTNNILETAQNQNGIRSSKRKEQDNTNQNDKGQNVVYYKITNRFWYHLFILGSLLGHEAWYAFVYSFLFWNVDAAVGRRVILVGNFLFYIGQGLKDIIRWPRPPMPPVVRLEQRWEAEYGMPSTHAMMALSLPLSVILFTMNTPFNSVWITIGSFWCLVVCCCRIYLGMHSLADVVVGLGVSSFLLLFTIPIAHYGDYFLLSSTLAPLVTLTLSILAILCYPGSYQWTPARGETTFIIGGYFGTQLGSWLGFQLGILHLVEWPSPHSILLPVFHQSCLGLMRVLIGLALLGILRAVVKPVSFQTACYFLNTDKQTLMQQEFHLKNKKKLIADLFCKFVTFAAIGFGITFVAPLLFQVLGCDRPSYWTEISLA